MEEIFVMFTLLLLLGEHLCGAGSTTTVLQMLVLVGEGSVESAEECVRLQLCVLVCQVTLCLINWPDT